MKSFEITRIRLKEWTQNAVFFSAVLGDSMLISSCKYQKSTLPDHCHSNNGVRLFSKRVKSSVTDLHITDGRAAIWCLIKTALRRQIHPLCGAKMDLLQVCFSRSYFNSPQLRPYLDCFQFLNHALLFTCCFLSRCWNKKTKNKIPMAHTRWGSSDPFGDLQELYQSQCFPLDHRPGGLHSGKWV